MHSGIGELAMDHLFLVVQSRKKMGKLNFVYAKKDCKTYLLCCAREKNLTPK